MKVAFVLSLLVAFVTSFSISQHATTERPVCDTEGCKRTGLRLRNSINISVNPCEDFFEFACGGFIAKHPIPNDRSSLGTFDMLDQEVREQLKIAIESAKRQNGQAVSVQYAVDQYHLCLDKGIV